MRKRSDAAYVWRVESNWLGSNLDKNDVELHRRAIRRDLHHFDHLRLGFAKFGLKAQRFPSGGVTQIKAEFRLREIVCPRRSESPHDGETVGPKHAAQFFERDDRLGPEMNHPNRKSAIE